MKLNSIPEILEEIRSGRPIVLIDDKNRENEGDLMIAAEKATAETVNFMIQHGKGLICISMTEERRQILQLPFQVAKNYSPFGTNFALSFDALHVRDYGVSAAGRAETILASIADKASLRDFVTPGFVFPVCAVPGGVLKRRGQTEGSVDLARLAGLKPAGVICEIMGSDGEMLRGERLTRYCQEHDLKVCSVEDICRYRLLNEVSIRRVAQFELTPDMELGRSVVSADAFKRRERGKFEVVVYVDDIDNEEHLAFVYGQPQPGAIVRIHSECLTGDIFSSRRCDCGGQLDKALEVIFNSASGVIVYLRQEGRGIGLDNKLRAYALQDQGLDTVEANIHLGFAPDSRSYRAGAQILLDLGLNQVRLLTNNPEKVSSLNSFGVSVIERLPLAIEADEYNSKYLKAKVDRLGHFPPNS